MAPFSWVRWLRSFYPSRIKTHRRRPKHQRLQVEELETRLAPAVTYTWTGGGGTDTRWKNAANWSASDPVNASPPPAPTGLAANNEDLVFSTSAPAASRTTVNDIAAGSVFNSITISGTNYTLGGNQITLGDPSIS